MLVDRVYDPTVEATGDGWCSVGVHDVEGGHVAVTHLIERGHRRIAYAGGPMSTPQVADRLAGARRAMEEAGLDDDQLTVLLTNALDGGRRAAGQPAHPGTSRTATPDGRVLRQ